MRHGASRVLIVTIGLVGCATLSPPPSLGPDDLKMLAGLWQGTLTTGVWRDDLAARPSGMVAESGGTEPLELDIREDGAFVGLQVAQGHRFRGLLRIQRGKLVWHTAEERGVLMVRTVDGTRILSGLISGWSESGLRRIELAVQLQQAYWPPAQLSLPRQLQMPAKERPQLLGESERALAVGELPEPITALAKPHDPGLLALSPELRAYLAQARTRIARTLVDPPEVRQQGLSGTVRVQVDLNRDGTVRRVEVAQSSSIELLDRHVINTVHFAAPFPALPKGRTNLRLTWTITFPVRPPVSAEEED